eukprot:3475563-Rhodomonas_salina.1
MMPLSNFNTKFRNDIAACSGSNTTVGTMVGIPTGRNDSKMPFDQAVSKPAFVGSFPFLNGIFDH